jgi:hypothetical protein
MCRLMWTDQVPDRTVAPHGKQAMPRDIMAVAGHGKTASLSPLRSRMEGSCRSTPAASIPPSLPSPARIMRRPELEPSTSTSAQWFGRFVSRIRNDKRARVWGSAFHMSVSSAMGGNGSAGRKPTDTAAHVEGFRHAG